MLYRLTTGFFIVVIVVAAALASFKSWVATSLDRPMAVAEGGQVIRVEPGSSLSVLSRKLEADGLIANPYPLLIHSRLAGMEQIKAGEYDIFPGDSAGKLLRRLVSGDVLLYRITFPEGRSLREWLHIINGHARFSDKPKLKMAALKSAFTPPQGENLEGWFFPDTYSFSSEDDGLAVLRQAHARMQTVLAEEWQARAENTPVASAYEGLILASIVEKETGVPEERGTIAGVFARRLQQGMKLQTDPTVIYGLGRSYRGNLTREHLRADNPYNTYFIQGLPPTPITNPGREAIRAALHPENGNSLFFVAKGDGSHFFSATLAEHEEAVRQYQLQRVDNYRSSPAQARAKDEG